MPTPIMLFYALLFQLLGNRLCNAAFDVLAVHERRAEVQTSHWERAERLGSNTILRMRIALAQTNLDKAPDLLMSV